MSYLMTEALLHSPGLESSRIRFFQNHNNICYDEKSLSGQYRLFASYYMKREVSNIDRVMKKSYKYE